jgi:WhiB family redox-sensing transcriptional regulator
MSLLDVSYPAWMDRAACNGTDVNFFPEVGETAAAARALCKDCPVREECLQWAVDRGEEHGVFGGLSAKDRRFIEPGSSSWQCSICLRAFRTSSGLSTHRARYCGITAAHGTHGTYGKGCRCSQCKSGHAAYMRQRRQKEAAA